MPKLPQYLRQRLLELPGFEAVQSEPYFNEFVLRTKKKPAAVLKRLLKREIVGGLDLGRFYPELKDCLLVCVTEQKSREQIDALVAALGGVR